MQYANFILKPMHHAGLEHPPQGATESRDGVIADETLQPRCRQVPAATFIEPAWRCTPSGWLISRRILFAVQGAVRRGDRRMPKVIPHVTQSS
ncbi:protein of unknown function (plasmid) [Cupriavidus neocaledonicus]|uniref:Uncharacterized protein n=2 Tax=Cupriavidus TaxID=106589 RepID=A0A7Z7NPW3_9BURK|nr:hypothetical protein CBM2594_P310013 [Cupriavidus taiwanensis]SPD62663.1 protein of unknown function [Cupriavidus neocaledonicus]